MALSLATKSKDDIVRKRYVFYVRETTADIVAGNYDTLSNWNTYLALFDDLGEFEDKSLKVGIEEGDSVDASDGDKVVLGYKGTLEVKYLQGTVDAEAGIQDMITKELDVLLVCTASLKFYNFYNIKLAGQKEAISGDVENWLLMNEKKIVTADDYLTTGAIPTS